MRRLLIVLLAGCTPVPIDDSWKPFDREGLAPQPERRPDVDVEHYAIRLRVDPAKDEIEGRVDITLTPLRDRISLDAAEMEIRSVECEGRAIPFQHAGDKLILAIPRKTTVRIAYTARPVRGLRFVRRPGGAMAWSQGQPESNRSWFPCYDYPNDRATSETWVTAPSRYKVISNGRLVGRTEADGWATTHHRLDSTHVAYLVSIVVAELDSYADGISEYHVPRGSVTESDVRRDLGGVPEMMRFLSDRTGIPYPYPKYAQTVVWDFAGGMENTSATTLYEHAVQTERNAVGWSDEQLVVHELAHQWFGDLVTCRSWAHLWLNEGFASYAEWLWAEHKYGRGVMQAQMHGWWTGYGASGYFGEGHRRPLVCDVYAEPDDMFDSHTYDRGGWVLHMLREELGDKLWWRGVSHYLRKHAHGVVDTRDFRRAMEEATGRELGWFFDQWVYSMGVPEFEVAHAWADGRLRLTVEQKQKPGRFRCVKLIADVPEVFRVPVEISIDGVVHRRRIDRRRHEFVFDCPKPRLVTFDNRGVILKKMAWKKSAEELAYQLRYDPEVVGRYWAAGQVADVEALLAATRDPSVDVARAAVRALAKHAPEALLRVLSEAKDPLVRRGAVAGLGDLAKRDDVRETLRGILRTEAPRVRMAACAALAKGGDFEAILEFHRAHASDPVVAPEALKALSACDESRARPLLLAQLAPEVAPAIRRAAAGELSVADPAVCARFLELLEDPDVRIRTTVATALGAEPKALPALRARLKVERFPEVRKALEASIQRIQG